LEECKKELKGKGKGKTRGKKSAVVQKVTGSTLDDIDFSFFSLRVS